MKNTVLLVILACTIFNSCSDNDDNITPACDVNNPVEDLVWLKAEISRRNLNPTSEMKYCYIIQAKLDGQDVFAYLDCNPLIDKAIFYFNCEGTQLNEPVNSTIENQKVIWKGKKFVCEVPYYI